MIETLEPDPSDKVLDIGTGSGYAAAILSRIVERVYTVEYLETLARQAESRFNELEYDNIEVHVGDGSQDWPEKSPYDGILVSACAPEIPEPLVEQLKLGGRLVIPVGEKRGC